jgi:FMN reductase
MIAAGGEQPLIVGISGTLQAGSQTEKSVMMALRAAEDLGADTILIGGNALELPLYNPAVMATSQDAQALVQALRASDGIILGSPAYHGNVSGLLKNAIDYAQELYGDERPYLDGRAVACVATAGGWQAAVTTLVALRTMVHALRGWPTPLGVAINSGEARFDEAGCCQSPVIEEQLRAAGTQVFEFAAMRRQAAA